MASPKTPHSLHGSPKHPIKAPWKGDSKPEEFTDTTTRVMTDKEESPVFIPEEELPKRVLRARKPAPALAPALAPSPAPTTRPLPTAAPIKKRAVKKPPQPVTPQPEMIRNSITGGMMVNPKHKDSVHNFHIWHPSMTFSDNSIKDIGQVRHSTPTPTTSDEDEDEDEDYKGQSTGRKPVMDADEE